MCHFGSYFLQVRCDMLQLGFYMPGCWLTWKFYMFSTCVTSLRSCVLVIDTSVECGWQGQPGGGDHGGRWHHDVSLIVMALLLLFAGVFLLLLHLDDVMNLGVVTHIEAVKHLNVPTINTVYHTPVPMKVHPNWIDTSWCHQPPSFFLLCLSSIVLSTINTYKLNVVIHVRNKK